MSQNGHDDIAARLASTSSDALCTRPWYARNGARPGSGSVRASCIRTLLTARAGAGFPVYSDASGRGAAW